MAQEAGAGRGPADALEGEQPRVVLVRRPVGRELRLPCGGRSVKSDRRSARRDGLGSSEEWRESQGGGSVAIRAGEMRDLHLLNFQTDLEQSIV